MDLTYELQKLLGIRSVGGFIHRTDYLPLKGTANDLYFVGIVLNLLLLVTKAKPNLWYWNSVSYLLM